MWIDRDVELIYFSCIYNYDFRELNGYDTFVILINLGSEEEDVILENHISSLGATLTVFTSSINSEHVKR